MSHMVMDWYQRREWMLLLHGLGWHSTPKACSWSEGTLTPPRTACSLGSTYCMLGRCTHPTHLWYIALIPCYTVLGRTQPQKASSWSEGFPHAYILHITLVSRRRGTSFHSYCSWSDPKLLPCEFVESSKFSGFRWFHHVPWLNAVCFCACITNK